MTMQRELQKRTKTRESTFPYNLKKVGKMNDDLDSNKHEIEFPNQVIVSIARLLLPEIQDFYNSNEGKAFFAQQENKKIKVKP